jgi:PAS domain S-box-containing protein
LLRTFIENVPFEVWARDKNEVGILENQHFANRFGSILGKTLDESNLPEEDIKIIRQKNERVKHGEVINEELVIFKNDEKRIYQNMIIPILADLNFVGIAGLSFDITEKKYSEMVQNAQYEIAKAIASSNDFKSICEIVHSELSNLIDASNLYIALYDDKTNMLHSPYNKDENDSIITWSADKSLTGLVIKQNKTFHFRKNQIEELSFTGEIELVGNRSEAWVGVPLLTDNKPVGAIVVQSYTNPNAYNHQSVEILEIIANQLTVFLERQQAEKELQDSLIQLNSVITNIPVVIYALDKNGIFTLSEGKGLELLGLKPGQVVGLSVFDIYKDFPVICNSISKCYQGLTIHTIFDVGDIIFDSWLSPIYDLTGNVSGIIGVSSDITDRIKADKELEISHKSYKSIFDNLSEFIFILDENSEFIEINDVVTNFYGFSREELIGKKPEFLAAQDMNNFDLINSYFNDTLKGNLRSFEFWCKTKSGEIFLKEVVFNSGEYFGKKVVIAVGRNINERKQAENDLRKAKERAEESDLLKTAFLANMSHEIRTPMNAILGFSHLLEANNLEPGEKKEYIALIHRRGHDLLNIINDILDISKIEANQMSIYQEPCNVNNIIEEVYSTYRPLLNESEVEIIIGNIIPNLPTIMSDSARLQQIILNLVSNSVKFTKKGFIEIGYDIQTKGFLRFYIKDTGVGVPIEKHKLIFERFRQSDDNPLTRQFDGAGLGLTICKGLIQLMGGDIWVESTLGEGSTFYFTIPYRRSFVSYKPIDYIETNQFDWSDMCVLIVEDDPINVKLLVKILEQTNINYVVADTGRGAIDLYRTTPFIDLVLLDIQLPDIDGYNVAQELLRLNSEVKIIAQTANAFSEDKRKSLEVGCKDYISKPIDQSKLLKIIDNVLNM